MLGLILFFLLVFAGVWLYNKAFGDCGCHGQTMTAPTKV